MAHKTHPLLIIIIIIALAAAGFLFFRGTAVAPEVESEIIDETGSTTPSAKKIGTDETQPEDAVTDITVE